MRLKTLIFSIVLLIFCIDQINSEEKRSKDEISSAQQRLETLRRKVAETLLQPIKPSRVSSSKEESLYPTGGSQGSTLSVSMSPRLSVPAHLAHLSKYGRRVSYRHQCRLCRIYKKCPRILAARK